MKKEAKGQYTIGAWKEEVYGELATPLKATEVDSEFTLSGGMTGIMRPKYLMLYTNEDHAYFNGMEHFKGVIDGREGSFTMLSSGEYKGGVAACTWRILKGSGKGDLMGIVGEGGYSSGHNRTVDFQLTYDFE